MVWWSVVSKSDVALPLTTDHQPLTTALSITVAGQWRLLTAFPA